MRPKCFGTFGAKFKSVAEVFVFFGRRWLGGAALWLVILSLKSAGYFRGARMDATLTITGVAEIVLNVRDLPRMREFYKEVLGFKLQSEACHETGPEPDAQGDPTIAFLTIKGLDTPLGRHGHPQLLALIDFERHVFAKGRFDGHEPTRSTLNHLAFEIPPESYEAHKGRLEAFGLRPRPVTFPAMTARALFFDDPEQNVLELIC